MVMFKANGESLDQGLSLSVSSTNMNRGYEQISKIQDGSYKNQSFGDFGKS